jgi:hypothetical protein
MAEPGDRMARGALLAGAAAISLGSIWDVSWDASIGVHSFWSPPHLTVNLGGLAVAMAGAILWRRQPVAASLALLGFAAMAIAEAIGVSRGAPPVVADAWSPLQILAVVGMAAAVAAGVAHAGARGKDAASGERALAAGLLLTLAATALGAWSLPNLQRTALFHQASAAVYPAILALVLALSADRSRWPASAAALLYMLAVAALVWTLPLFAATPATQPVFQTSGHMLPPRFPLLLVAPAIGFDLARRALPSRPWLRAPLLAAVFCVTFVPAQWYFSAFLLAPASDGWLFAGGGQHWPFFVEIGAERAMFWGHEQSPLDTPALGRVFASAILSATVGQVLGSYLQRARRN